MSNPEINQLRGALRYLMQQATMASPACALPKDNAAVRHAQLALDSTKPKLLLGPAAGRSLYQSLDFMQARFGLPITMTFMAPWHGDLELYNVEFFEERIRIWRGLGLGDDVEIWRDLNTMHLEYEL